MIKDINVLGGYPSSKPSTEQGQSKKPAAVDNGTANNSTAVASSTNDVQLSSQAKTLHALADKVNRLPEANMERAEQIKAALQQGEYKIDDLVVATKLLNSEALFGK